MQAATATGEAKTKISTKIDELRTKQKKANQRLFSTLEYNLEAMQEEIKNLEKEATAASEEVKSKINIKIEKLKMKRDAVSEEIHAGCSK